MKTKVCCRCKKELLVANFRGNAGRYDGLQSECIECRREYNREHYRKNKKVYADRARKRKKNAIIWFGEYKSSLSCKECGDDRSYVLEFHHKNREDKEFNICEMVSSGYKIESILKEIEKCDILCANCHRELHYFERQRSLV